MEKLVESDTHSGCSQNRYRSGISFVVFSRIFIDSAFRFFHSRKSASFCNSLAWIVA
jgi:hypothetical protein